MSVDRSGYGKVFRFDVERERRAIVGYKVRARGFNELLFAGEGIYFWQAAPREFIAGFIVFNEMNCSRFPAVLRSEHSLLINVSGGARFLGFFFFCVLMTRAPNYNIDGK